MILTPLVPKGQPWPYHAKLNFKLLLVSLRHTTKSNFTCWKFHIQTPLKLRYQWVPLQKLANKDTSKQDLCTCQLDENWNTGWKWCQIGHMLELDWRTSYKVSNFFILWSTLLNFSNFLRKEMIRDFLKSLDCTSSKVNNLKAQKIPQFIQ